MEALRYAMTGCLFEILEIRFRFNYLDLLGVVFVGIHSRSDTTDIPHEDRHIDIMYVAIGRGLL